MDDTDLFGSDLSTTSASHERLAGTKGGRTSLFSDSDDLFSSSSYKAPVRNNVKPNPTQSNTSKFDPLFIHNSMTSEDSVDGIPNDGADSKKDNVSNRKTQEKITDPLFDNSLKDDLFSTSTESDSSILPKSNITKDHKSKQNSTQKSKTLFDEKDDLFGLSTESESSVSRKTEVVPQSVPKAEKETKPVDDKKADVDDLFNQSTESDDSKKAKRNQKSEIDSLFDTKTDDDLFSKSGGSGISPKPKAREDVVGTQTQNSKTDLHFDTKQNEDLFGQSTDSTLSEKEKPAASVPKNESSANPIFDSPPKDDLFSKTSQKAKPKENLLPKKKEETLFDSKSQDDLFNQSVENNKADQAKPDISAKEDQKTQPDPLFDSKAKDDLAGQGVEVKKSSSQKVQVVDDDDDDEDDLFKPNSRLFSPPPLDFDSDVNASGDFAAPSKPKAVSDDIFNDDDDIFAPKSTKKKENENKADKEKTKVDTKNEKESVQVRYVFITAILFIFIRITWKQ
jgi:hypothetical protein